MVIAVFLDIIAVLGLVFAAADGRKRGIIKMGWRFFSWIVTIVLAVALSAPFSSMLSRTQAIEAARNNIQASVEQSILSAAPSDISLTAADIADITGIPETLIPKSAAQLDFGASLNSSVQSMAAAAAQNIANSVMDTILRTAASIILLLLLKIGMSILYHILVSTSKLPIIHGANSLLGMAFGLISAMFVIYAALAAAALLAGSAAELDTVINSTYIVKYFYNNNILLQLIKL